MLVFWPQVDAANNIDAVVILDALSSDDRFGTREVASIVEKCPIEGANIRSKKIYACEYDAKYEHNAIPLGAGIKTSFQATVKSPPSELISRFSPRYFTSAKSIEEMSKAVSFIANPQTTLTYGAMVVRDSKGGPLMRFFIAYAAPVTPDSFGTTITMLIRGGSIDDILIKSKAGFQVSRDKTIKEQLDAFLATQNLSGKYLLADPNAKPSANKLLAPAPFARLMDDICLQEKLVWKKENNVVTFYSQGLAGAPKNEKVVQNFSFLGSKGAVLYNVGVENYANLKFNTIFFDVRIFDPVNVYNDAKNAFFAGLTKVSEGSETKSTFASVVKFFTGQTDADAYLCYVIRYAWIWNRRQAASEITASNNWLLSQFRVDAFLEGDVFKDAIQKAKI